MLVQQALYANHLEWFLNLQLPRVTLETPVHDAEDEDEGLRLLRVSGPFHLKVVTLSWHFFFFPKSENNLYGLQIS